MDATDLLPAPWPELSGWLQGWESVGFPWGSQGCRGREGGDAPPPCGAALAPSSRSQPQNQARVLVFSAGAQRSAPPEPCRALGSASCHCPSPGRWLLSPGRAAGSCWCPLSSLALLLPRHAGSGRVAELMSSLAATTACAALWDAAPARNEFLVHLEQGCWPQPRAGCGSSQRCGLDQNPCTESEVQAPGYGRK